MKKRFSAIIILSITMVTFSFHTFDSTALAKKWKKSGSDLYYKKGNVGIGTSTPSTRLEVYSDTNPQILVTGDKDGSGETGFVVIHFRRQGETRASIGIAPKDGFVEIPASAYTVGLLDGEVWSNPFIIEQKAPTGSLFINSTGNVGIGTTNPTESLEVEGNINASGSITEGSSRNLKKDITNISLAEATETLKALNPVKFKYKVDNSEEEHLGFIAEDVPSLVGYQDRKRLSPMDITAVMTKVMQEQQREIQEQKKVLQEQQKIISELLQEMREIKNKI